MFSLSLCFTKGKCGKCPQQPICPLGTKPLTRECCAGFFGPQCQPCPGKAENVCFGNGICLDGMNGTGVCECGEGFRGTACETCAEGKYGIHCDQGAHSPPHPGRLLGSRNQPGMCKKRVIPHVLPKGPVSA
ncbi:hypothetical protein HPG69_001149, partial [Diceros bicornis minor]